VLLLTFAAVAFAQDAAPTATMSWRPRTARIHLAPPEGHHLAHDAPLRAELMVGALPWSVDTEGLAAAGGMTVPLPPVRPLAVSGTVDVSVCDDAGTRCELVQHSFQVVLDTPKGRDLPLEYAVLADEHAAAPDSLDAALAEAGDGLVVIDFGAVWCPPCNLLAAEVLHDPEDAQLFDDKVLYEVDVDDHASWPVKDRYAVGGYPTMVAVDAAGNEVARLVGYPGESAVHDWLDSLSTVAPLSAAPDPASITPEEAAAWARRFVDGQRGSEAAPFFARASESDTPLLDAQIATYGLLPTPALARVLADAEVPVTTWGWPALSFAESDPGLAEVQRQAAMDALADAAPAEAADLFWMLAKLSPADAQHHYLLGALSLTAALSGDIDHDRGHLGFLSRLWEEAGEVERAIAVLDEATAHWPEDMTFHEDRAALALRQNDVETAIVEAEAAVRFGHGDNKLRATELLAKALHAGGRTEEAIQLVVATLQATEAPPDGLDVRTPRYLKALRALPFMPRPPAREATPPN